MQVSSLFLARRPWRSERREVLRLDLEAGHYRPLGTLSNSALLGH
jgi:hypothetical protein